MTPPAISMEDIRPVTEFQRNAKAQITRLRKTKRPMVLTVNGSAAVVVQDAATYEKMVARLETMEKESRFIAAVNEGIREADAGKLIPLEEAFASIRKPRGSQSSADHAANKSASIPQSPKAAQKLIKSKL